MTETAQTSSEDPVAEWLYLSDRAQQIYGGLVGLSDFGHWDTYFARTFDIYTRLWRFQQQHRATLESKDSYGLQRWEIGDIATRIAQLYYHYYLRTSEVSYLQEAFLFYEAVRTRNYYKPVGEKSKASVVSLYVKQLRFYARFIVTCLLLDRRPVVNTLVEELSNLINEYSNVIRGAGETQEWHLVLQEITLFLQADVTVSFKGVDFKAPPRRTLFPPRSSPLVSISSIPLKLQSCILVGCHQHQVKFSELTLDMYRMMYCLEREPVAKTDPLSPSASSSGQAGQSSQGVGTPRSKRPALTNPKKYLLYRPTVSQVLLYLASAQRELYDNGVLLLYISADGEESKGENGSTASSPMVTVPPTSPASISNSSSSIPPSPLSMAVSQSGNSSSLLGVQGLTSSSIHSSTSSLPGYIGTIGYHNNDHYTTGGVRLRAESASPSVSRSLFSSSSSASSSNAASASPFVSGSAFFPSDVTPFTRRPTFIIVDSDSSHSFLSIAPVFGAPLLVLVSPQETPVDLLDSSQAGSLFTYFLHDPLAAFLFCSNKSIAQHTLYSQVAAKLNATLLAIDELFSSSPDIPQGVAQFTSDEFMRALLVRFCFCYYTLKLRVTKYQTASGLPASSPQLPPSILANSGVITLVKELAATLGVSNLYF